ncbi:MAG: hypothetical protein HY541_08895 [Deltaproteobacteria bacterium]|nr:hypothetical protein [Deltaproteobacteria bacterium]
MTLPATIGPPIAESGQKHPFFGLIVVGMVILIGAVLAYFGLKKRLKKPLFRRGNS